MTTADQAAGAIREALAAGPTSAWLTHPRDDNKWRENSALAQAASPAALVAILDEMDRLREDAQQTTRPDVTPRMIKAAADAWLDCDSRLIINKARAALIAGLNAAGEAK